MCLLGPNPTLFFAVQSDVLILKVMQLSVWQYYIYLYSQSATASFKFISIVVLSAWIDSTIFILLQTIRQCDNITLYF